MNDCHQHLSLRIETELDGSPPPAPHCGRCEAEARVVVRIVSAGRELRRAEPPEDRVEAGRRRLLRMIRSGGPGGLAAFLALLGGVFLASLALTGETDRRIVSPGAVVSAAVGTAGAAAASALESRARRRATVAAEPRLAARRPFARMAHRPRHAIMEPCAPVFSRS